MFKIPKKVIEDIPRFKESLEKYLSGEINDAFFRGIRVPWGNYSQRGGKYLMSRLRIPGGIILPQQLREIGKAAEKYGNGNVHITTRQDIQIHSVPYENSIKVIEDLKKFEISPCGGGGNTVRNVTSCPYSGICPCEKIEVYKIAAGVSEYLLGFEENYNLPRKFKISFSGCEEGCSVCGKDCGFSGVNDVGFYAANGKFKVLVGGGMGAKSAVGKVIAQNVEIEDVLYIIQAVINVYNKYGDHKNKHHNRLRFLIEDIGWEKFVSLYQEEYKRVKETQYIVLREDEGLPALSKIEDKISDFATEGNGDPEYKIFLENNIFPQKQSGYYCLKLRIPLGETTGKTLIELADLENDLPQIIFRTTKRQNIMISNVPFNKVQFVYDKLKNILFDFLYPDTALDIISCKAAATCNLGICNCIEMGVEIIKKLKEAKLDFGKFKNVNININGCPNSCGMHPVGTISFQGLARKVHGRTAPFYKISLGGMLDFENTKLTEEVGVVPSRRAPELLIEYLKTIQEKINGNAAEFILASGRKIMLDLIKKYSFVPPYEEDRTFYIDWGKTEDFSLDGLSQGECGAGVMDMMKADLDSANQSLIKAKEKDFDLEEIKHALVYCARALLVVKGIDPKTEVEAINSFVEKFINTGHCEPRFKNLVEIYRKVAEKAIEKTEAYNFTKDFYEEVKKLYSLMDSGFNFPVRFSAVLTQKAEIKADKESLIYDLRGTPCPINYVKAKMKLEDLEIDDILEIYLDEGEPIRNVPASLKKDGQEIIEIKQVENYYNVIVRKTV